MSRVGGRKQPPAPLPYRPPPPRSSVPAGPGYLEVKFQPSPDTAQKVTSQAAVKPIREYEDSPPSVRKQAVQLAGSVAAARRKDLEAGLEPVRGAGASAATAQPSKPLAVPAAVSAAAPTDMGALLVMRARADFAAIETGDLSFSKGDLIVVTNTHGQDLASGAGWWTGHREDEPGITGDFPSNYMEKQPAAQIAAPESAAVAMATAGPSPGPQPGLGVPLGSEPEPEPELVVVPGAINEVNPGRLWCVPRVPVAEMRIGEFCDGFAEKFELRVGPNYQRNGRKEPSGPALYDFVGATLLHSPAKLDDLLGSLPDLIPPSHRAGKPVPPAGSAVPEYFLLNVQLPCGAAVTFNKPLDGETMNLAFLWRVSAHVVENLESGELSPPVALLEKYCKIAPTIKGPKGATGSGADLIVASRYMICVRLGNVCLCESWSLTMTGLRCLQPDFEGVRS